MKKTVLAFILFTFSFLIGYAQTPDWEWAKSAGGSGGDYVNAITTDALGNIYMVGDFLSANIFFDSYNFTNSSANHFDIFLVKYDTDGNVLWAKKPQGDGDNYAFSISCDYSSNIYIAGYFGYTGYTTLTFDNITLTSAGDPDIFLAKYDPNGNVVWVKGADGIGSDYAYTVANDVFGNTFLAGVFGSDNGPNTLTFDTIQLTNNNMYYDIFITKCNSVGNTLWAKSAGGFGGDYANSIACDTSGNVYMAGYFSSDTIKFDTIALTNNLYYLNLYIAKYEPKKGNVVWAKNAGGNSYNSIQSITCDILGNIYAAGNFQGTTIIFDTITLTNTNTNFTQDVFLAKYNSNGDVLWAKSAGGTNIDRVRSITLDSLGNVYVAGDFGSTVMNFGNITLTNSDYYDTFIAKYDSNGNVLWAKNPKGNSIDIAYSTTCNTVGSVYVAGTFSNGPNINSLLIFDFDTLTNVSDYDIFLAKLNGTTGIEEKTNTLAISIFPNPTSGKFTLQFADEKTIKEVRVYNVLGEKIYEQKLPTAANFCQLNLSNQPEGIYFVQVQSGENFTVHKVIVQ